MSMHAKRSEIMPAFCGPSSDVGGHLAVRLDYRTSSEDCWPGPNKGISSSFSLSSRAPAGVASSISFSSDRNCSNRRAIS